MNPPTLGGFSKEESALIPQKFWRAIAKNLGFMLVAALFLAACGDKHSSKSPSVNGANAAVYVSTVRAQQRDWPLVVQTNGSVTPLSVVDVKPQTNGMLARAYLREGQFVRAGQLLFTLDARAQQAQIDQARAQLAKTQAALTDAQRQLVRAKQLLAQNFVSQGAVDSNLALVDTQLAALAADQAALDAARVAWSYTQITAPSAGRAGVVSVYPGSAVQANQTNLVTITQIDPMTVAFNLPQRQLTDTLAALHSQAPVKVTLPDTGEAFTGRLQFVDNAVDAASGTVKVKAVFANAAGKLWPGAFVNVSLTLRVLKDAVVVPQASLVQGARGTSVYVVQAGKALQRAVQVLQEQGGDAAVSGVQVGEQVVLNGRQNVRPGSAVIVR